MGTILVGCLAVWGLVTAMTGGNWQAGGVVAFVVLCVCVSGLKATRRQEEAQAEYVAVRVQPEEQPRWWRR